VNRFPESECGIYSYDPELLEMKDGVPVVKPNPNGELRSLEQITRGMDGKIKKRVIIRWDEEDGSVGRRGK